MSDTDRKPEPPVVSHVEPSTRHRAMILALKLIPLLLAVLAIALLMRLLIVRRPVGGTWVMQMLLALAALFGCCWGEIRRQHDYSRPLARLLALLPRVRLTEAPIEELDAITGPLSPLSQQLQALFQDLREKDRLLAEAHEEMRQRVAARTEALERSIGGLKAQAKRDCLTGLHNRRSLEELLPKLIDRAKETRLNLCVLMIDVDNFKLLNDTRGHAAGDELLKTLGQLLRSSVRDHDVAFRFGGDEFVVVLSDCPLTGAQHLSERLTSLIDAMAPTLRLHPPVRLSIGIAGLSESKSPTPEGLLAAADQALYAIKSIRGRVRRAG